MGFCRSLPGQRDNETIKAYARRTWQEEPKIRAEFNDDFDAYASWCWAYARGRVRILGGGHF